MQDCIFCRIVVGEESHHKVWEDEKHIAFLSIFPNTEGVTVVITKDHYPSDFYAVPEEVFMGLTEAARKVGALLNQAFDDVARTGLVYEGFGVDHLHAKLFPMHGTQARDWKPIISNVKIYSDKYDGHISTHDGVRADDDKLAATAKKIIEADNG